jgi:hypothetical protein
MKTKISVEFPSVLSLSLLLLLLLFRLLLLLFTYTIVNFDESTSQHIRNYEDVKCCCLMRKKQVPEFNGNLRADVCHHSKTCARSQEILTKEFEFDWSFKIPLLLIVEVTKNTSLAERL